MITHTCSRYIYIYTYIHTTNITSIKRVPSAKIITLINMAAWKYSRKTFELLWILDG